MQLSRELVVLISSLYARVACRGQFPIVKKKQDPTYGQHKISLSPYFPTILHPLVWAQPDLNSDLSTAFLDRNTEDSSVSGTLSMLAMDLAGKRKTR